MTAMPTAQQAGEAWNRNLKASTQRIREGVSRVTEHPGQAAAANLEKMVTNFLEAVRSGKWLRGVTGYSLEDWKRLTSEKGIANLAAGVDAATPKFIERIAVVMQDVEASQTTIDRMPSQTFEDRMLRMVAFSREMHDRASRRA